jgi:3-methyl-2-oxobutanoate hydroxymethyltransferase
VLVVTDLLGLDAQFKPRFARRYLDGASLFTSALDQYARDVKSGGFPAAPETVA